MYEVGIPSSRWTTTRPVLSFAFLIAYEHERKEKAGSTCGGSPREACEGAPGRRGGAPGVRRADLRKQKREDLLQEHRALLGAAVHERRLLARVAVQVHVHRDLKGGTRAAVPRCARVTRGRARARRATRDARGRRLLARVCRDQQLLERVNRRVVARGRLRPPPIEVDGRERAAIVPEHHAVGVQHWHDEEEELPPQRVRLRRVSREELEDPWGRSGGGGACRRAGGRARQRRAGGRGRAAAVWPCGGAPCIIHDALLSPGWTRAETQTTRRAPICSAVAARSVTQRQSHSFPASVVHSRSRRTCRPRDGSAPSEAR